jgi:succinoglycan biosynthesis transport protein ExoP
MGLVCGTVGVRVNHEHTGRGSDQEGRAVELGGVLHVARRWWTTLVLAMCLAGLAGYYAASRAPQVYESRVKVLVGPTNTDLDTQRASGQLATTYAELVTSRVVLDGTISALQLPFSADELRTRIRATADTATRIMLIRVTDSDAARAAAISNDVAAQLMRITSAPIQGPDGQLIPRSEGTLMVVDSAAPGEPTESRSKLIVIISALAGLLGVLALLLVFENLNQAVRNEAELFELTGSELLGSMPTRPRGRADRALAVEANPDSPRAAAHRLIATKIELSAGERPIRSVLIAGARSSSLGAELTANVALVLASHLRRVVVVDANSDTAEVTTLFRQQQRPGLAELTQWLEQIDRGDGTGVSVAPFVHSVNPRIDVMPLGQSAATQPREVTLAPWLINRLLESADLVLVNAPPVDRSAAALICARTVDATVLVVRPDKITREELRRVVQTLRLVGASVIGTVVEQGRANRWHGSSPDSAGERAAPLRRWAVVREDPAWDGREASRSERQPVRGSTS